MRSCLAFISGCVEPWEEGGRSTTAKDTKDRIEVPDRSGCAEPRSRSKAGRWLTADAND